MHPRINHNHCFTLDHLAAGYVSLRTIENSSLPSVVLALRNSGVALTSGRNVPLTVSQILKARRLFRICGDHDGWALRTNRRSDRREHYEKT